jgi:NADH-quinone oxidoreductase subunit N
MTPTVHDVALLSPVLVILGGAAAAIAADLAVSRIERGVLPFVSLGGLAGGAFALLSQWGKNEEAFGGAIRVDDLSVVMGLTALGAAAISVLMSASYARTARIEHGEYYALMLTASAGAVLLAQANDLVSVFLGIEVLSVSVYCLTGIARDREKSAEAAMKYFVMGAFSTGFLLFGIAFLYGAVASTSLPAASQSGLLRLQAVAAVPGDHPFLLAGLAFFVVGAAFKVGAVPFHAWTPDAYEGAPAPVTGFMAAVVKAGAFALLVRAAMVAFPFHKNVGTAREVGLASILAVIAAATMVAGNLFALAQTNLKRLLAYSSIGHTGYVLVGLIVAGESREAAAAVVYYVAAYAAMTVGGFGLLSLLTREGGELEEIGQLSGLAARRPGAAAAMTLFLASLAGIPPTAGFMGKFLIFREAVRSEAFLWLALVGIATSMLSAYYYLKVVVAMYMREPAKDEGFRLGEGRWGAALGLAVAAAATIAMGVFPARVVEWSLNGIEALR